MAEYIIESSCQEDGVTIVRHFSDEDAAVVRHFVNQVMEARTDLTQPWLRFVLADEASDEMRKAAGLST